MCNLYVKSLNQRETVPMIASAIISEVKFMNSFTRCQHVVDITTKLIDIDSNFPSYHVPSSQFQLSFDLFMVVIASCEFHLYLLSILV